MAIDNSSAGEDKHLYRRGVGFLKKAQCLRGLSPAAVDRIEHRLQEPRPRAWLGRRPWLVAATVSCVVLLAGTLAVARVGLRRLPLVGALFVPKPEQVSVPAPRPRRMVGKITARPPSPDPVTTPPSPTPVLAKPEALVVPTPPTSLAPAGAAAANATPPAAAAHPISDEVARAPAARAIRAIGHASDSIGKPDRRQALAAPVAKSRPSGPDPVAEVPPPENPVLAESRSFSTAIEHWHRNHDPVAALVALDEHDRHFPGGRLQIESRLLRAEILLAQGRERDGLAVLDRMSLAGSPRARELFTVRGELRIKAGRCREGRADLNEVLSRGVGDGFGQRAVAALAGCP